jgi:hypothetical protein
MEGWLIHIGLVNPYSSSLALGGKGRFDPYQALPPAPECGILTGSIGFDARIEAIFHYLDQVNSRSKLLAYPAECTSMNRFTR